MLIIVAGVSIGFIVLSATAASADDGVDGLAGPDTGSVGGDGLLGAATGAASAITNDLTAQVGGPAPRQPEAPAAQVAPRVPQVVKQAAPPVVEAARAPARPVIKSAVQAAQPVVKPVAEAAQPVVKPAAKAVAKGVETAAAPVEKAVRTVTAPVLGAVESGVDWEPRGGTRRGAEPQATSQAAAAAVVPAETSEDRSHGRAGGATRSHVSTRTADPAEASVGGRGSDWDATTVLVHPRPIHERSSLSDRSTADTTETPERRDSPSEGSLSLSAMTSSSASSGSSSSSTQLPIATVSSDGFDPPVTFGVVRASAPTLSRQRLALGVEHRPG